MSIKNRLLDLLYPQVCGICGKFVPYWLCIKCRKMLEGYEVRGEVSFKFKNFTKLIYIFPYDGIIREMLLNYKFNEKPYIYNSFVNFIIKNQETFENLKKYDKIIPVPISKKRFKERGYNQSYLIAKSLAKKLEIECDAKVLRKIKNNKEQNKLNKEQREINAIGAYKISKNANLEGKKVLLLDDIYTTGNTANECCKILKEANPKLIDVFVLAKD